MKKKQYFCGRMDEGLLHRLPKGLLHKLPEGARKEDAPEKMVSPYVLPVHPWAVLAAQEVTEQVHAYMQVHPESELHTCGKMFGVLVVMANGLMANGEWTNGESDGEWANGLMANGESNGEWGYLAAYSAMWDGSYEHEGFVPPVYAMTTPPVGTNKAESQRLQRLLFAQYRFLNGQGETKDLLELFTNEKAIVPMDEWFGGNGERTNGEKLPPSGAGECCAPKLLQYAFANGLKPLALAEFWVGAAPRNELRQEGAFYTPCSGKCVPILKHQLEGLEIGDWKLENGAVQKPEILFEDEWLMVVNKPSGMLSVPGKTGEISVESYCSLQNADLRYLKAVHRLDQDTSGLLVLAKTPEVYKTLQAYFQRRDILKRYEAVVTSERVNELKREGEISLPLLPNPYDRPRQMVNLEHGKPAITRYVIRERRADGTALVDFYPLTGRTHQLRVHAAHPDGLNAPIVGDRLYGTGTNAGRLMLHAAEITFLHPVTGAQMHYCSSSSW